MPENQRRRDHRPGIGEDLPGDSRRRGDDGQHGNTCSGVIVPEAHRQRPVVRRGPEEHDQEQQHRLQREAAGDRGPADQRGQAARDATPHDVLRRSPLQQDGVHHDVEDVRGDRQRRGQRVDERQHQEHGGDQQDASEHRAGRRRNDGGRDWPPVGAPHHGVDVALEHLVERVSAAGRERPGQQGDHDEPERRNAALRQDHRREGRHQQQLDDPQFHQRQVGDPGRPPRTRPRSHVGQTMRLDGGHDLPLSCR